MLAKKCAHDDTHASYGCQYHSEVKQRVYMWFQIFELICIFLDNVLPEYIGEL